MKERDDTLSTNGASRRSFLGHTSAALVATASLPILVSAQQTKDLSHDTYRFKIEH